MSDQIDFTKSSLNALLAADAGKRSYYLDDNKKSAHLRGFGLVVNDKGRKHFLLTQYFKRDRKTVRLRCGEYPHVTVEQARKKAEKFQTMLNHDIHPTEERQESLSARKLASENERIKSITLTEVLTDYLRHKELKESTKQDYIKVLKEVWLDWLEKPMLEITDELVKDRYRKRLKTSVARGNYAMRVTRALFNFAKIEYKLPDGSVIFDRNPVNVLSEGKTWHRVERRKRIVGKHALADWLAAVEALDSLVTKSYIKFLLFTGARRSEAARLLVSDVNFEAGVFTLRDTKNGSDVTLPMSDYVMEILRPLAATGETWIFKSPMTGTHIKDPRKGIRRVIDKSGVEFSLHDLRRTFITTAEGLDISYYAIKALVNHKSRANTDVTEGYLDIAQDYDRLRKASQRITDRILISASKVDQDRVVQFKSNRIDRV